MNGLRNLRERAGVTLRDLADATGLHLQTIVRYQNGGRRPSRPAAKLMARTLGVTETELDQAIASEAP